MVGFNKISCGPAFLTSNVQTVSLYITGEVGDVKSTIGIFHVNESYKWNY